MGNNHLKHLVYVCRWLLVLPAALAGYLTAFFLFAAIQSIIIGDCRWGSLGSNTCYTPPWLDILLLSFGGPTAAVLFLMFGTSAAPRNKRAAARALYLVGVCHTLLMLGPFIADGDMLKLIPLLMTTGAGWLWVVYKWR